MSPERSPRDDSFLISFISKVAHDTKLGKHLRDRLVIKRVERMRQGDLTVLGVSPGLEQCLCTSASVSDNERRQRGRARI